MLIKQLHILLMVISLIHGQDNNNVSTTTVSPSITTSNNIVMTVTGRSKEMTAKQRLRAHLMQNYDKNIHPVEDHNEAVQVRLGMALIHLDIDEKKSLLTADAWMRMAWNDPNLAWQREIFENVSLIHFGSDEIWKPDILLYNSAAEAGINHYGNTNALVEPNGDVLWVPPGHFKAYCKMNMRQWPFDTQVCQMKFGSWTSHGNLIKLGLYRNSTYVEQLNVYTDNRQWKIIGKITAEHKKTFYDCCDEPYPDVTFTFNLQRDSQGYRAIVVLPCLVIMLMTGSSFLLTPTSGEKLLINSIAILSAILYLLYFAMTLPFTRDDIPIIVTFYSNITALVGIAILLNVVCMSLARERKYQSPPKFLKNAFGGLLGKCLCLGNYYHQVSSTHQRLTVELTDMAESEQQTPEPEEGIGSRVPNLNLSQVDLNSDNSYIMRDWILVAAGLERLFFTIYALAFAIITSVYV